MTKTCTKCKKAFPLTSFFKKKKSPDGLGNWCTACREKSNPKPKEPWEWLLMRRVKGAWTSGGHIFNGDLNCGWCGQHYDDHQLRPARCPGYLGWLEKKGLLDETLRILEEKSYDRPV